MQLFGGGSGRIGQFVLLFNFLLIFHVMERHIRDALEEEVLV